MTHDTTQHYITRHNMTIGQVSSEGQHDSMTTWQYDNRSGQVRRSTWQHNKMTTWQHDNMTPWQHDNVTIWQQVRSGHKVLSDQLRTGQVSKGQVRSGKGQVRSCPVRSGEVRWVKVVSGGFRSGEVSSGKVRSREVNWDQVRSYQGLGSRPLVLSQPLLIFWDFTIILDWHRQKYISQDHIRQNSNMPESFWFP